jgi:hypothetical protein
LYGFSSIYFILRAAHPWAGQARTARSLNSAEHFSRSQSNTPRHDGQSAANLTAREKDFNSCVEKGVEKGLAHRKSRDK